jgi:hypothetical protein
MKKGFLLLLILNLVFVFAQDKPAVSKNVRGGVNQEKTNEENDKSSKSLRNSIKKVKRAKYNQYQIFGVAKDTVLVDTSLTIKKDYKFNLLRKDIFGLLPFANDGHTYNTLDFNLNRSVLFPQSGFRAKHFNYLQVEDMRYFKVATPLSDLYFKTVLGQGQSLDAFVTMNLNKELNFSIAYKGIRSLGRYFNELTSAGNFRFTSNYDSKNGKYSLKTHITAQDISNQENGGLLNIEDFTSDSPDFSDRGRLSTFLNDAKSYLDGTRFYLNQTYKLRENKKQNNIVLNLESTYESKVYSFTQETLETSQDNVQYRRFGDSPITSKLRDSVFYASLQNKLSASFETKKYGQLTGFVENMRYHTEYDRTISLNQQIIPNRLFENILLAGGQIKTTFKKFDFEGKIAQAITDQGINVIDLKAKTQIREKIELLVGLKREQLMPNINMAYHQSSYTNYIWFNDFKNTETTTFFGEINTKYGQVKATYKNLVNHIYFENIATDSRFELIKPLQASSAINYLSVELNKEIKFRKWALDNRVLFQQVDQSANILNLPQLVNRHTIYYSSEMFKKALFFQTGVTVNYFTAYHADGFNPVLNEFFTQNETKIGNFPIIDVFFNARVRQTRIYFKAEHINVFWDKTNYFSAPNHPYSDFVFRFGLVWNFFQ